ncbi:MAG: rane protein [Gemmataceae bacterium]|nr:rane protein [Gemmataceae bacterium]
MLSTPLGRLRLVGLVEGVSYLLLLGIAMPLKYLAGLPEAVLVVGWGHGVLFMLFMLAIAQAVLIKQITVPRAAGAFVASILPAGPFVLDPYLRHDQEAITGRPVPDVTN